jgi:ribonuclease HII
LEKQPASRRRRKTESATRPRRRPREGAGGSDAAGEALRERFEALLGHDRALAARGFALIAGVDEAGRGALAGPVVSAAVVLRDDCDLVRIYDSKSVTESDRESLFSQIIAASVSVGIGVAHPPTIDRDNILRATLGTMHRAVSALRVQPDLVLIDGRETIQWPGTVVPLVKGDSRSLCVAAASIVAKVTRDRVMRRLNRRFPGYHFDRNKGYGTRDHLEALAAQGAAAVHRRTFLGKIVENNLSMF